MTADDIVAMLNHYYDGRETLAFAELRIGTGYGKDAEQRIDYWVMEPIPSKRFRRIAYEIKVSRSDLRRELADPRKRRRALLLSNEFYFICPAGLIRPDEVPPECGLAEVSPIPLQYQQAEGCPYGFRHTIAAPWRDGHPPTWQFLAAVTRRAARTQGNDQ